MRALAATGYCHRLKKRLASALFGVFHANITMPSKNVLIMVWILSKNFHLLLS